MPSYTTPPTWGGTAIVASSDLQILSDDISYLKAATDTATFSGVLVDRNAVAQSIPNNTPTLISFTRETADTTGWVAVTSTDITVPSSAVPPGYTNIIVEVDIFVEFASNSTGYRRARLLVDGAGNAGDGKTALSGTSTFLGRSWKVIADAGTVFQLEVTHDSGSSLNVSNVSMWVSVYKPLN